MPKVHELLPEAQAVVGRSCCWIVAKYERCTPQWTVPVHVSEMFSERRPGSVKSRVYSVLGSKSRNRCS